MNTIAITRTGKNISPTFEGCTDFTKEDHRDAASVHGHISAKYYDKKKAKGLTDHDQEQWRQHVNTMILHKKAMFPGGWNGNTLISGSDIYDLQFSPLEKESSEHAKKQLKKFTLA